ncbi:Haloacid dehalogenase-like hydrolase-domain-containing protein [Tuber borchii]|uniref:Haloacid dehalogenase-like hydrolase-domain-containing protein n=1 Tax=Tuber borchii TaxID=42251 RepID=A0A2T6ZXB8_TUBBO|nr:Haloacid dehalogenase-like hydrolase-domain-containing protein [Tuber borchii]
MATDTQDNLPVFFFDIDNCLYSKSKQVHHMMKDLIDNYFRDQLQLDMEDAKTLHKTYYTSYGLAIEGLARYHKIDPLDYNSKVDDALPLDQVLHPDPGLRKLISDIDRTKVRLWLFTNAYVNHGRRVVKLLGIDDLFDGITYCDYTQEILICKPKVEMFEKAMKDASITDRSKCYFVDDSTINCQAAISFGWENTVQKLEPGDPEPSVPAAKHNIHNLEELRALYPEFFKQSN